MPVEIRELVIKMVVEDNSTNNKSSAKGGKQINGTDPDERLVNLCVEKVFEILKEKMER